MLLRLLCEKLGVAADRIAPGSALEQATSLEEVVQQIEGAKEIGAPPPS
jgi:hypothetical protein